MIKFLLKRWGVLPEAPLALKKSNSLPAYFLRAEALVFFLAVVVYYFVFPVTLLRIGIFLVMMLAPDLSLLAYKWGPRAGGLAYNIFHFYPLPLVLVALGTYLNLRLLGVASNFAHPLFDIGLAWIAHIAQDRMRGLGLRYPESFYGSHLHKV